MRQNHYTTTGIACADVPSRFPSLCALSIRNSLVQLFRSSNLIGEESIRILPRDILYVLPSISKLSAFIYGLSHFETEKGKTYLRGPQGKTSGPPDNQAADEKWQTILKSKETVVKIVERPSGIPLIILHGTSTSILRPEIIGHYDDPK